MIFLRINSPNLVQFKRELISSSGVVGTLSALLTAVVLVFIGRIGALLFVAILNQNVPSILKLKTRRCIDVSSTLTTITH